MNNIEKLTKLKNIFINLFAYITHIWIGCGWQVGQMLSSLLTSSTMSGNHTAVLQAGKPTQDRYLLQEEAGSRGETAECREDAETIMRG